MGSQRLYRRYGEVLVRNQASCHEDMAVQLHTFLFLAVDGGEWSVSPLHPFKPL